MSRRDEFNFPVNFQFGKATAEEIRAPLTELSRKQCEESGGGSVSERTDFFLGIERPNGVGKSTREPGELVPQAVRQQDNGPHPPSG